jgi:hypothetical protein
MPLVSAVEFECSGLSGARMTLRAKCGAPGDLWIRPHRITILGLIVGFAIFRTWGASPSLNGNECWSFANLVLFETSLVILRELWAFWCEEIAESSRSALSQ